jgi:hypothetical protein
MTQGALIFAFNNEHTNYLRLAAWSAKRIHQYLSIPVAVVTNDTVLAKSYKVFDHIIVVDAESGGTRWFDDYAQTVTWHNAGRTDAYALSPWDETLVLDADYVVNSDILKMTFLTDTDFVCFRHAFDVAGTVESLSPTFGRYGFPMWWATVMRFCRSSTAEYIFDSMNMVKQNWSHYRDLYGIESTSPYRNDYALSIALGIVSGHTLKVDAIPWQMPTVLPSHELVKDQTQWIVKFADENKKLRSTSMAGMDFHAMGKSWLEKVIDNE